MQWARLGKPNHPGILEEIVDWPEGRDFGALPEEVARAQEAPPYNELSEDERCYALFTDGSGRVVGNHRKWKAAVWSATRQVVEATEGEENQSMGYTMRNTFTFPFSFKLITTILENFEYTWDVQTSTLLFLGLLNMFKALFHVKLFKNITQRSALRLDSYDWQVVRESMGKCLGREGGIDKAIGKKAQALSLWRRLLSSGRERYPFSEDVVCRPGKWTTMERGIQYLRELAVREMVYYDPDNVQLPTDPDEVQCTRLMWRKIVRSAPSSNTISQVIHECETCAAIKQAKQVKPLWYGGRWLKYKYGEAWQIDYITLPQTRQGKCYVPTMVEATTGWLETYPVPHATARNTILGLEKQVLW
ncbi:hypothetical protein GRJ2_003223700 [Grus japonensis]|uniref:Integrase catalytic domain-containing protein n=1 Tax=Grus japonensis TaxID=30415 RepID=A0ABC9YBY5_GRUJA